MTGERPGTVQVAVFNTSEDVLRMVEIALRHVGLSTVSAHIDDVKHGRLDVVEFLRRHDPDVVVYDVAPPYEENWTFLRLLRDAEAANRRAFVITTTNKAMLEKLVGPTDAHEIVGKPFDIDALARIVRRAVDARSGG